MNKQLLKRPFSWALIIAFTFGAGTSLAAKYYKWVDENGVTHYSAQPPAAGQGEIIKVKSGPSSDKDQAMKRLEERREKLQQDAERRANPEKDLQAEADKKNAEALKEQCERTRKNLKIMKESARVRELGPDGEGRVLPEEERQQRVKDAQEFINQNCS